MLNVGFEIDGKVLKVQLNEGDIECNDITGAYS